MATIVMRNATEAQLIAFTTCPASLVFQDVTNFILSFCNLEYALDLSLIHYDVEQFAVYKTTLLIFNKHSSTA